MGPSPKLMIKKFLLAGILALNISCTASGCTPSSADAVFSTADNWYPGKSLTKTIKITNDSGDAMTVYSRSQNATASGNLDNIATIKINSLWAGTLADFFTAGNINLGSFAAGESNNFSYTVSIPQSAGNIYQNKFASFDLLLGFSTTPVNVLGQQENLGMGSATSRTISPWWQQHWWLFPLFAGGGLAGFLIWWFFFRKP